mgnify:CR=1 FL=1
MRFSVELSSNASKSLLLRTPVLTASGTFGNGVDYNRFIDIQALGGVISKAVTLKAREGNPQPRILEVDSGMLNSIGLQNIGVDQVILKVAPVWATWKIPVIVNIAATRAKDYGELSRRLDNVDGISGIEINISCPNVEDGMEFGTDPKMAAKVTREVRGKTSLPVIVKLTPNAPDITDVAQAVYSEGADALTIANTMPASTINQSRKTESLGWGEGGLSGPALKQTNLKLVASVARSVPLPIIGSGGIMSGQDALDYILAGATAVQVGTATFTNPNAAIDITEELLTLMKKCGASNVSEIIGSGLNGN